MDRPSVVPTPGRPRDPQIDDRVLRAALELFGRHGWAGLSMEAVAHRAGVGKPTVYRRWPDKGTLMADALRSIRESTAIDTGSFEGDLTSFARHMMDEYSGPFGPALARYAVEAKYTPEVGVDYSLMVRDRITDTTAIVRRAIDRGEIPDTTRPHLVISMLHGAIMDWVLFDPSTDGTDQPERTAPFLAELVRSLLRSVGSR